MVSTPTTGHPKPSPTETDGIAMSWRWDMALIALLVVGTSFWGDLAHGGPGGRGQGHYLAAVVTSLAMTCPVFLHKRRPLVMLAVVSVAGLVQCVTVPGPTASLVAVPIVAYLVAKGVSGPGSRLVLLSGATGALLGPLRWTGPPELGVPNFSDWRMLVLLVAVCFSAVLVPYLIGRRLRDADISTVERARAAQDRYVSELVAREERSRTIEARVRNDIARELHDVVAHSLSVIIVQAEGGKAMARKNPAVGAQTLDTIAETGREALSQMRRMVGVLRAGPDGSEWAPQPGLDDIAELVTRAGSRVSLKVHGAQPTVPATVGLPTYRVVQEALTNFFKHAGPRASCRVEISYTEATIKLDIIDNGDGSKAFNDGVGNGVKGMRERVTAAGGELSARARRTGGFQVSAVLPTRTDEGTAPLS